MNLTENITSTTNVVSFNATGVTANETSTEAIQASLNPIIWSIVVAMCIGTVGVLDNCFTLVVILSSKTMREKVNNKLIINQSAIDAVASLLLIVNAPNFPNPKSPTGIAGELWCRLWVSNYFLWSTLTASSFNLTAITIERYMAIIHPLAYKRYFTLRRSKLTMAGVWAASFIFVTLPNIGPTGVVDGICCPFSLWPNRVSASIVGVLTFIAVYFGPIVIMIFCYTRMVLAFRKKAVSITMKPKTQTTARRNTTRKMQEIQYNILKTLITVALAFVICWSSSQITFFLFNLGVKVDMFSTYFEVFVFLAQLNCCINPFIYTFQYQEFKEAMRNLLSRKQSSQPYIEAHQTETTM